MKNFLKGLVVRLTGVLLVALGFPIGCILLAIGVLSWIIAAVVYILTGVNWLYFAKIFFGASIIPMNYGFALLSANKWVSYEEFKDFMKKLNGIDGIGDKEKRGLRIISWPPVIKNRPKILAGFFVF